MSAKCTNRRRFNGRKAGTYSDAERAKHAFNCWQQWMDLEIRAKRHAGIRRAADVKIAKNLSKVLF